jgi:hypothetical protein
MVCSHLRELYDLCETNQLRLGGADLIRVVCKQCNQEETCPSVLMDEYDSDYREDQAPAQRHGQTGTSESQQSP